MNADLRRPIEARLAQLLPPAGTPLADAMRHAALGPGQRLRPLLLLLGTRELGAEAEAWPPGALDAGCALELVHAASLALDDLPAMDDSATRRGRPATHVRHGEDLAILAAVTLLARAFGVLAALPGCGAALRLRLSERLAEAVQALALGQVQDLRGDFDRSLRGRAAVADCGQAKTGGLFELAIEMAALLSGCPADDPRARALVRCAEQLGRAYQLHDDLRDAPSGVDRSSHVVLFGEADAREALRGRVDAALAELPRRDGPLGRFVGALFA